MSNNKVRLFVDMDGTLCVFRKGTALEDLYQPRFFLDARPHKAVVEAITRVIESTQIEVYILSCYLHDSHYALQEKIAWLNHYMPMIKRDHMIFVPYGTDKLAFLEEKTCIMKNDYLLDDYTKNLVEWSRRGSGIKLVTDINDTRKTWDGSRVYANSRDLFPCLMKAMYEAYLYPAHQSAPKREMLGLLTNFINDVGQYEDRMICSDLFRMRPARDNAGNWLTELTYFPDNIRVCWRGKDTDSVRVEANEDVPLWRLKRILDLCRLSCSI